MDRANKRAKTREKHSAHIQAALTSADAARAARAAHIATITAAAAPAAAPNIDGAGPAVRAPQAALSPRLNAATIASRPATSSVHTASPTTTSAFSTVITASTAPVQVSTSLQAARTTGTPAQQASICPSGPVSFPGIPRPSDPLRPRYATDEYVDGTPRRFLHSQVPGSRISTQTNATSLSAFRKTIKHYAAHMHSRRDIHFPLAAQSAPYYKVV